MKNTILITLIIGLLLPAISGQAQQQAAPQVVSAKKDKLGARSRLNTDGSVAQILNQYVQFPSRDGFEISLDMTVEFELLPDSISWLYMTYGDLPAVVDNIIMPQIQSITRNKGSEYQAKDFIMGEGREKFQEQVTDALANTLKAKKIVIHNALIRHVNVPDQILDPVQKAGLAGEQDLTNQERQNTAKKQAELNTQLSLIEQKREQVAQETTKIKAEIDADQQKQVAEIQVDATLKVAQIEQETASLRADKTRKIGQAMADSVKLVEGEKANGYQMKVEAFGDPVAFSMWEFANSLNRDVRINIFHSGQGTLWTDLEKAKLGDLGGAKVISK